MRQIFDQISGRIGNIDGEAIAARAKDMSLRGSAYAAVVTVAGLFVLSIGALAVSLCAMFMEH